MPNLNMNNFQTRNKTFDPDPLPYLCTAENVKTPIDNSKLAYA